MGLFIEIVIVALTAFFGTACALFLFHKESKRLAKHRKEDILLAYKLNAMKDFLWQAENIIINYNDKDEEKIRENRLGFETAFDQFSVLFGKSCNTASDDCYNSIIALLDGKSTKEKAKKTIDDLRIVLIERFSSVNIV